MTSPRSVPDERPPGGCLGAFLILSGATILGLFVGAAVAEAVLRRRIGLR